MTTDDSPKFESMLAHWADDIIIPAYTDYLEQLDEMYESIKILVENPTDSTLAQAQTDWLAAYISWQSVSMFDIGMAEQIGLRNYTNIYPTDSAKIGTSVRATDTNLELPSNMSIQGFPALEALLYSEEGSEIAIIKLQSESAYGEYLLTVSSRLQEIAELAANDWQSGYREAFVAAAGTSATASVNKVANDFLYYYERALRANKVGIPAGIFSTTPLPEKVEGKFANGVSKQLFLAALDATQSFFNGHGTSTDSKREGFATYLAELNQADLAAAINEQFNKARTIAEGLDDDFEHQVITDNLQMLVLYDELQKAVIMMKVDMMQTMNIKVDYIDADGD